jgi:hypothetical protein
MKDPVVKLSQKQMLELIYPLREAYEAVLVAYHGGSDYHEKRAAESVQRLKDILLLDKP